MVSILYWKNWNIKDSHYFQQINQGDQIDILAQSGGKNCIPVIKGLKREGQFIQVAWLQPPGKVPDDIKCVHIAKIELYLVIFAPYYS